jgi:hypothetical protein
MVPVSAQPARSKMQQRKTAILILFIFVFLSKTLFFHVTFDIFVRYYREVISSNGIERQGNIGHKMWRAASTLQEEHHGKIHHRCFNLRKWSHLALPT